MIKGVHDAGRGPCEGTIDVRVTLTLLVVVGRVGDWNNLRMPGISNQKGPNVRNKSAW